MTKDYYEELGIVRDATEDEIKAVIDKMSAPLTKKALKGDKAAEERLTHFNEIKATLTRADQRADYDMELSALGASRPDSLPPVVVQNTAPARPPVVERDVLYDHYAIYGNQQVSGFGRGVLESTRTVADGDLLTIRFAAGTKEIIAWHQGLAQVK